MNKLWFGEHVSSQKIFKKFLKHAGQPTRKGMACHNVQCVKGTLRIISKFCAILTGKM